MRKQPLHWYDPLGIYPESREGYVYVVRLAQQYIKGWRTQRLDGSYVVICWRCGKRKLIGGITRQKPQYVSAYMGWSPAPEERFGQHTSGQGSKLLGYLASINWPMALIAIAPGGRELETQIKRWHNNLIVLKQIEKELYLTS